MVLRTDGSGKGLVCRLLENILLPKGHRVEHALHLRGFHSRGRCEMLLLMKLVDETLNEISLVRLTTKAHAHLLYRFPRQQGIRLIVRVSTLAIQCTLGGSHV